jgi:hypothetical protein
LKTALKDQEKHFEDIKSFIATASVDNLNKYAGELQKRIIAGSMSKDLVREWIVEENCDVMASLSAFDIKYRVWGREQTMWVHTMATMTDTLTVPLLMRTSRTNRMKIPSPNVEVEGSYKTGTNATTSLGSTTISYPMARQSCHGSRLIINYGVLWSSESVSGAQKVCGPEKTWRTVHYLLGRHNKWAKAQVVARNDTNTSARASHYMVQPQIAQFN